MTETKKAKRQLRKKGTYPAQDRIRVKTSCNSTREMETAFIITFGESK